MYSSMITLKKNWMDNMKTIFALIILGFLVTACTTTYVVSSSNEDTSIDEFNYFAKGQEAEIILRDTTITSATDVFLSADSLSWIDPENILKSTVVKSDVRKVIFSKTFGGHLIGGLEGWGFGIPSGGIAGLVTYWVFGQSNAWAFYGLLGIGVAVGAIAGITTGLIIGHTYEFRILDY